jgi:PAS domain S-box-containing protein
LLFTTLAASLLVAVVSYRILAGFVSEAQDVAQGYEALLGQPDSRLSPGGDEAAQLAQRAADSTADARKAIAAMLVGGLAIIGMLLVVFVYLQREIMRREKVERVLRSSYDEIEDLYNHAPCGYHSLDADGVIVRINDTELSWLGYTREEVIGRMHFVDVLTPESVATFRDNFPHFLATGEINDLDFTLRRKDGTELEISLGATAILDADGNFLKSRSTLFDITRRKQAEARIAALHRDLTRRATELEVANRELESFSYSVSHDLRSPLRAIDGFSRMLEEDYAARLDAEGLRLLKVIRDNSRAMGRLIDDLLEFSRLGRKPVSPTTVNMEALAGEALQEVLRAQKPSRVSVVAATMPGVLGDQALIKQVWVNLLSNGVKFSSRREQPQVEIGGSHEGEENVYFVRDNGAGFDMRYYDKLFGVFQRLHRQEEFEGTGVGLAIVQRVISRLGGRVWAESSPDQGASFYFTLPAQGGP